LDKIATTIAAAGRYSSHPRFVYRDVYRASIDLIPISGGLCTTALEASEPAADRRAV
jgi:hypothetical protein